MDSSDDDDEVPLVHPLMNRLQQVREPLKPHPKSIYVEQEAEEEDDEFKGLGGVDGEDEGPDVLDPLDPLIVQDNVDVGLSAEGEERLLQLIK